MRAALQNAAVSGGAFIVFAVAFAGAEATARWIDPTAGAAAQREIELIDAQLEFLEPCLSRRKVGADEQVFQLDDTIVPFSRFAVRKTPGIPRLAVVGESSALLLGELLQRRRGEPPSCRDRYEVMRCGQLSASIEHVERRVDEVLAYRPDVIVLIFGHNVRFRFPTNRLALMATRLRAKSYLLSALAGASAHAENALPQGAEPVVRSLEERLPDFDRALERIARRAADHGAKLVLTTMPANLWVCPVDTDREDHLFHQAVFLEATGDREGAIALLSTHLAGKPRNAFQMAVWLADSGDFAAAARAFDGAIEADPSGGRASERVNEHIRTFARTHGLGLRDSDRERSSARPDGLPGWELLRDNCHLRPAMRAEEATSILDLVDSAMGKSDGCVVSAPAEEPGGERQISIKAIVAMSRGGTNPGPWIRSLPYAVERWARADHEGTVGDIEEVWKAMANGSEPDLRASFLEACAEGLRRAGNWPEALAYNERARSQGQSSAFVQQGLFSLRSGNRREAELAFAEAVAHGPEDPAARDFLQLIASEGGERK